MLFQNASKFFDAIDVVVILMKWDNFKHLTNMYPLIEQMIDFLISRGFSPYAWPNSRKRGLDDKMAFGHYLEKRL
jgi:hypothetical protein